VEKTNGSLRPDLHLGSVDRNWWNMLHYPIGDFKIHWKKYESMGIIIRIRLENKRF